MSTLISVTHALSDMPLYVLIVVSVTCTFLYIKVSDE